jgi:hypothetical protein
MNKKHLLIGVITAIIGIIAVSGVVVEKRLSDLRDHLEARILEQSTVVSGVATALAQNITSPEFTKIVPECSVEESTVYDTLLSSLDKGLSPVELSKLDVLFDKCGGVVAARRVGMSLTLANETSLLKELTAERVLLGDYKSEEAKVEQFVKLSETENEISQQFMKLVQAQGQIIAALQANIPSTAVSLESIRSEAQVVREELERLTVEVSKLRGELLDS